MRHRIEQDHRAGRKLQRDLRLLAGRQLDGIEHDPVHALRVVVRQVDAGAEEELATYSWNDSPLGSCAAMWRTRGVTVKVTSTFSSSVGS